MRNSEKRVALVTGASRGIGKAIAQQLADDGFVVVGTATSVEGANRIDSWLSPLGGAGMHSMSLTLTVLLRLWPRQTSALGRQPC